MNWEKGISEAKKLLLILSSNLSPEKKTRKIFTESDLISSDDATALRRNEIHIWREKFLTSDLPNLKEDEQATAALSTFQDNLLREIKNICKNIIAENTIEKSKDNEHTSREMNP